jgi:hypothetical protein
MTSKKLFGKTLKELKISSERVFTPQEYAMPIGDYFALLRKRDGKHIGYVERALNIISEQSYSTKHFRDKVITAVGSSLVRPDYNDIDLAIIGISPVEIGRAFLLRINNCFYKLGIKTKHEEAIGYAGYDVSSAKVSEFDEETQKFKDIIHILLDESGQTFQEWHKGMVERREPYCILG